MFYQIEELLKQYFDRFLHSAHLNSAVLSILLFSYAVTYAQNDPIASFTVDKLSGCPPLTIQFTNTSTNATSYFWDFGNGSTSTLENPSNVYLNQGMYTITLVAISTGGQNDSLAVSNLITVLESPIADFYALDTSLCSTITKVSFVNTTTDSDNWLWDLGDGTISTLQHPKHFYGAPGTFSVTLIADNVNGCSNSITKVDYIKINEPVPNFTVDTQFVCIVDHMFMFNSSASLNTTGWLWNFGDSDTSSLQNPSHTYATAGTYTVSLTAFNSFGCSETLIKTNYISIDIANPIIIPDVDTGCVPLDVTFNYSASNVVSWLWDFGDGDTSSLPIPTHIYNNIGTYDVSLTVTNSNNCTYDTLYSNLIVVQSQSVANFTISNSTGCAPLSIQFTDNSTDATTWFWEFGDGNTSTLQNPSHPYSTPGFYTVYLTVSSPTTCEDVFQLSNVIEVKGPVASFAADSTIGCVPFTVSFSDYSSGAVQWLWDFGDGNTSSLQHPFHLYDSGGIYNVTLIVTDTAACTDTVTYPNYIQALSNYPNYTAPPTISGCLPLTVDFNDQTANATSWLWDFDDGTTSTLQSPTHTYVNQGNYTVSLQIGVVNGCDQYLPVYQNFYVTGNWPGFEVTVASCAPYVATFTDTTSDAVSWFWDFGDGTTSTLQHPTHTYANNDYYSVELTITTSGGCTKSMISNNILVFPEFIAGPCVDSISPDSFQFFSRAEGIFDSVLWDFGDSTTSTLLDPIHGYSSPGTYVVSITMWSGNCQSTFTLNTDSNCATLPIPGSGISIPDPSLPYAYTGCTPILVEFYNVFPFTVSWFWDLGDGTTSTLENPTNIYHIPGGYDITLIAQDTAGGYDTLYQQNWIVVYGIDADFSYQLNSTCDSLKATFTDSSTNATQWFWDFGDGTTSTLQNPVHTYPISNTIYTISLTATDSSGSCPDLKISSLFTGLPDTSLAFLNDSCITDTIYFSPNLINYSSYLWDFGDGDTSTDEAPFHVYDSSGIYQVSLTIIDSVGCVDTYTYSIPININELQTDFTMSNPVIGCDTLTVHFTNQSISSQNYLWNFGDNITSTQTDPSHFYGSPGVYHVTLTGYNNGCEDTLSPSDSIVVHKVSAGFTFSQDGYCFPITATYTDTTIGGVSWQWDFGDGDSSILQHPTHVFDTIPSTDVTLIVTDLNGCQKSIIKSNIEFVQAKISVSDSAGCTPLTVSFNDSTIEAVSWRWDFGDGDTSNIQNPTHTYTDSGIFEVTFIVESAGGCGDTQLVSIRSDLLIADFNVAPTLGCELLLVIFNDLSVNAVAWSWDLDDSTYSAISNPAHLYPKGIYSAELIVSDIYGCTDSMASGNIIVQNPIASFTVPDTSGCTDIPIQVSNMSLDATGWNWNFGDGNISTEQEPQHAYEDTGQFIVTLEVTDSLGCFSTYSLSNSLFIFETPIAGFIVSDSIGCEPLQDIVFTDTASNWMEIFYSWDFGDGSTSSDSLPVHTYTDDGIYNALLTVTTVNSCAATSDSTTFDVLPVPQPTCIANPAIADDRNPTVYFQTEEAVTYLWNFGDGDTSNLINPVHTYPDTGTYLVSLNVVNEFNCTGQCQTTVVIKPYYGIIVPTAFTPNPEGPNGGTYDYSIYNNDVFFPITEYVEDFHMMIFNRWGELIFESFDLDIGWDGYYRNKLCQQDLYAWKIEVVFENDLAVTKVGNVTLIR